MSTWIHSRSFDLSCIIAPTIMPALLVLAFPGWFAQNSEVSIASWVLLVLCIDVAHVYSTLFRTYLDEAEFDRRRILYQVIPVLAWVIGCLLYTAEPLLFWRVLAYIAVYHFVRQQYGFMSMYLSRESRTDPAWLDRICIYLATLYPIVFWHTHPREFSWFVENDFFRLTAPGFSKAVGALYLVVLALYVLQEVRRLIRRERVSLAKNLLLLGTALSWYVGIVLYNGDLVFTLTNVVAHGIPYIALIWIYERRKLLRSSTAVGSRVRNLFQIRYVPVYICVLILLSFVEELFWDAFVWREKAELFGFFQNVVAAPSGSTLAWVVPLLAVPQITHYIVDGFIWRIRKPDSELKDLKLA